MTDLLNYAEPYTPKNQDLPETGGPFLSYKRMDSIQPKPIDWLWRGFIPFGKVCMIAGDPGLGKSQITANIAAILTASKTWPLTDETCPPGSVVFLSAEDDPADTIRPRLEAAGADLARVIMLEAVTTPQGEGREPNHRLFNLKTDLQKLGRLMEELGDVSLVVIDPITAYLGDSDSHKNAEIRALLAPLSDLAAKHQSAVVCVSHLNKGGSGGNALSRVSGSLAFVAAPRAAFLVAKDPQNPDRRLFLQAKNNLSSDKIGLAFSLESVELQSELGPIQTSRVVWEKDPVSISAEEAFESDLEKEDRSSLSEAMDFLREVLVSPTTANEVKKAAANAGHAWRTVERAKKALKISVRKQGKSGGWVWALSKESEPNSGEDRQERHTKPLAPLASFNPTTEKATVKCAQCRHFTPNLNNPKAGIGECAKDQAKVQKKCLWPRANRVCSQFEVKPC